MEAGRGNEVGYVFSSRGDVLNQEELSRVVELELSIKDRAGKLSKPGLANCILRVKDEHAILKYQGYPSEGFGHSGWEETKQWQIDSGRCYRVLVKLSVSLSQDVPLRKYKVQNSRRARTARSGTISCCLFNVVVGISALDRRSLVLQVLDLHG